jgi:hypothetical protein
VVVLVSFLISLRRLQAGSEEERVLMLHVRFQVDGMSAVREDGHTNALYVFYLISYVVIINWILLQVETGLQ